MSDAKLCKFIRGSALHNLASLIYWLEENCQKNEEVEVYQWYDHYWYITVKNNLMLSKAETADERVQADSRIGFTVNIARDRIVWNNDVDQKGNCFIRDGRWKRLLNALGEGSPPDHVFDGNNETMMHFYKDHRPKKVSGIY